MPVVLGARLNANLPPSQTVHLRGSSSAFLCCKMVEQPRGGSPRNSGIEYSWTCSMQRATNNVECLTYQYDKRVEEY